MHSSPASRHFLLLRCRYSPWHPVLEHSVTQLIIPPLSSDNKLLKNVYTCRNRELPAPCHIPADYKLADICICGNEFQGQPTSPHAVNTMALACQGSNTEYLGCRKNGRVAGSVPNATLDWLTVRLTHSTRKTLYSWRCESSLHLNYTYKHTHCSLLLYYYCCCCYCC